MRALAICQSAVEYERIVQDKKQDKELEKIQQIIPLIPLLKKLSTDVISKSSSPSGIVLKVLDILKLHISQENFAAEIFQALNKLYTL